MMSARKPLATGPAAAGSMHLAEQRSELASRPSLLARSRSETQLPGRTAQQALLGQPSEQQAQTGPQHHMQTQRGDPELP